MSLTHRRNVPELSNNVMLFAEDGNEHYGDHVWTLESTLPRVTSSVVNFCATYYNIDEDEANDLVNPENIVSSAGAWDDVDFVSAIWQAMEMGELEEVAGFMTNDGAVLLDRESVKLSYHCEE